jgi:hypothetical protein
MDHDKQHWKNEIFAKKAKIADVKETLRKHRHEIPKIHEALAKQEIQLQETIAKEEFELIDLKRRMRRIGKAQARLD